MNVKYRQAIMQDIEHCAIVEQFAPDIWSKEGIKASFEDEVSYNFVAESEGEIIAFCSLQVVCREANLNTITVLPQYRRCGVAQGLLDFAFCECDADSIYLEVRSQNNAAIELYKKLCFTKMGMRKAFYTKPSDDAIIMSKIKGDKL